MLKDKNDKADSYLFAALSYFWIASVIIVLLKKKDSFVMFHAKQGLVIFIGSLLSWFPIIGWLFGFGLFLASVAGFIKALQGERYKLPIIYDLSEKLPI